MILRGEECSPCSYGGRGGPICSTPQAEEKRNFVRRSFLFYNPLSPEFCRLAPRLTLCRVGCRRCSHAYAIRGMLAKRQYALLLAVRNPVLSPLYSSPVPVSTHPSPAISSTRALPAGKDPIYGIDSVGTVPAALAAYSLLSAFKPDILINAGTAGGFKVCALANPPPPVSPRTATAQNQGPTTDLNHSVRTDLASTVPCILTGFVDPSLRPRAAVSATSTSGLRPETTIATSRCPCTISTGCMSSPASSPRRCARCAHGARPRRRWNPTEAGRPCWTLTRSLRCASSRLHPRQALGLKLGVVSSGNSLAASEMDLVHLVVRLLRERVAVNRNPLGRAHQGS